MKSEILVGAKEFWMRLQDDLRNATQSAYIQTFTFEGDRVGLSLSRALEASPATDRRLLVDSYSLLYHSDRIIPGPAWLDKELRREVMLTHRSVKRMRNGGVDVRFGNRLGPSPLRLIRRNHKKIAVFDGKVAYVGGINFSEHNFAWHDMMYRVECEELAALLADDFIGTWEGRPLRLDREIGPLRVISLNGVSNRDTLAPVVQAMAGAERSIDVVSAYLSVPFTGYLASARSRGVRVRVLTPQENNKANLARHILEVSRRENFDVFRGFGMSHMKAMLVDEELLVIGSSNFDFMSYNLLEELVVMTRDRAMVDAFVERVWTPDFARAVQMDVRSSVGTRLGHAAVHFGALLVGALASN